jgi:hypothetical protein
MVRQGGSDSLTNNSKIRLISGGLLVNNKKFEYFRGLFSWSLDGVTGAHVPFGFLSVGLGL